jgi:hypothetical protein
MSSDLKQEAIQKSDAAMLEKVIGEDRYGGMKIQMNDNTAPLLMDIPSPAVEMEREDQKAETEARVQEEIEWGQDRGLSLF